MLHVFFDLNTLFSRINQKRSGLKSQSWLSRNSVKTLSFWSRFHQHFTRAFFVQNFGTKNYKAVFWDWNFLAPKYRRKKRTQNVEKNWLLLGYFWSVNASNAIFFCLILFSLFLQLQFCSFFSIVWEIRQTMRIIMSRAQTNTIWA